MVSKLNPTPEFIMNQWESDTIDEYTTGAGVTVDGVLLKDGGIVCADAATIEVDTINEATSAAGVTVDGVQLKDGTVKTDTLVEKTSAAGVTADGVLLKDGRVDAPAGSQILTATGAITINNGTVQLNHATVVIAATLDAPTAGDALLIVDNSASGTAAHTVTLPAGVTFDGTNNTATLNAPGEALLLRALSATRWFIVLNIGSVALSSV